MRKPRGLSSAALGLLVGLLAGLLIFQPRSPESNATNLTLTPNASALLATTLTSTKSPSTNSSSSTVNKGGLLFVGVMTARKYLGSRARAVHESWGSEVPGALSFYSSEDSRPPVDYPNLPLVALPKVDDSYPPQKKSFLMLQHMWREHGSDYEWFLRADDDLYVRMDRLERFLRSVDSRKPHYIGQAGRGNSEEFGLLSLEYDENFCMGGPGVLLSRETLRRIVPHIKYCLANLYTTHEDVELGRCVRKFAGISCTWSYEMQSILYHNSSGDLAFTGKLKSKEVHRAISLHPVKSPPHMYRLHNYMRGLKIQDLQQERLELQREIERMSAMLSPQSSRRNAGALVAASHSFKSSRRKSNSSNSSVRSNRWPCRHWDFISRSEYSLGDSNPRRRLHVDLREGLEDVTREVMASINSCSRQRGRFVEERQALYGYRRRTAEGVDTVLDLLLLYKKYRGRKVTLPVRRHLYLHQHFTGLEMRELDTKEDDSQVVNFVVPVWGRDAALRRFLFNFERVCLAPRQRAHLVLVLYPHDDPSPPSTSATSRNHLDHDPIVTSRLLDRLRDEYGEPRVRLLQGQGKFTRARALAQGIELLNPDELAFFVDVDIGFEASVLTRIRRNTLRGSRVYFPVVFSQYDPRMVFGAPGGTPRSPTTFIDERAGFWRQFGYGIVALYRSDYDAVGGFDLGIEGWGKEDVDLFEKVLRSGLGVFRAPDLDLVHVYHGVSCDASLEDKQFSMCKGTRADTYASTQQLAEIVYRNPEYLKFAKQAVAKAANASSTTSPAAA